MNSRTTTILIVLGLLVLAAAGYLLLRPKADPAITASGAPSSDAEAVFVALTSKLGEVTFDTDILHDPRFMSLVDIRTAILPEVSGRADPFAPLPGIK